MLRRVLSSEIWIRGFTENNETCVQIKTVAERFMVGDGILCSLLLHYVFLLLSCWVWFGLSNWLFYEREKFDYHQLTTFHLALHPVKANTLFFESWKDKQIRILFFFFWTSRHFLKVPKSFMFSWVNWIFKRWLPTYSLQECKKC